MACFRPRHRVCSTSSRYVDGLSGEDDLIRRGAEKGFLCPGLLGARRGVQRWAPAQRLDAVAHTVRSPPSRSGEGLGRLRPCNLLGLPTRERPFSLLFPQPSGHLRPPGRRCYERLAECSWPVPGPPDALWQPLRGPSRARGSARWLRPHRRPRVCARRLPCWSPSALPWSRGDGGLLARPGAEDPRQRPCCDNRNVHTWHISRCRTNCHVRGHSHSRRTTSLQPTHNPAC
jgi:hypothetical protein